MTATCPTCSKEIDYLLEGLMVAEYEEVRLSDVHDLSYSGSGFDDEPISIEPFYDCPACRGRIANNQKGAIAFLRGGMK